MKKALIAIALMTALWAAEAPARADDGPAILIVKVDHISSKKGNLRLALYDAKSFEDDGAPPIADKVVPAVPYSVTVAFDPVPSGTYAVKMFQDYNRNEKFDFDWLGLPDERYGFSRNARPNWMRMSGPDFKNAAIELKPGENWTEIWLH
ncbi:MAG TPA: DUF2141 domain-containing protein [Rhizomicrobium sp.]|nr:DUF2141 domain-containing protein [Rhizomicrobium sp.]